MRASLGVAALVLALAVAYSLFANEVTVLPEGAPAGSSPLTTAAGARAELFARAPPDAAAPAQALPPPAVVAAIEPLFAPPAPVVGDEAWVHPAADERSAPALSTHPLAVPGVPSPPNPAVPPQLAVDPAQGRVE